jgi:hypothetical protein
MATTQPYGIEFMKVREIELPADKELEVATDGSGLKTNNAGEYRIFRYGEDKEEKTKKKHLVVVITADVKHKKLLKVEAHVEGGHIGIPDSRRTSEGIKGRWHRR